MRLRTAPFAQADGAHVVTCSSRKWRCAHSPATSTAWLPTAQGRRWATAPGLGTTTPVLANLPMKFSSG